VIELTGQKLREAKFFFRLLNQTSQEVVLNAPEVFEFYLSAFLSAARSVTFVLQYEEKDKYDDWFPTWFSNRSEDDRQLLNFLKKQRNFVEKRGGAEISLVWELIPVTEVRTDDRGHPAYGIHWFEPPETPPTRVGLPVHSFDLLGDQKKVISAGKRYLDVLDDIVRDFIQAYS